MTEEQTFTRSQVLDILREAGVEAPVNLLERDTIRCKSEVGSGDFLQVRPVVCDQFDISIHEGSLICIITMDERSANDLMNILAKRIHEIEDQV